jgi:tRNA U34 2-thiouridine synthase MnmA/TrmU
MQNQPQKHKVIVMYSGGLDSTIAIHLLKSQDLDVTALHFRMPFNVGVGTSPLEVMGYADALGVPLRVEEEGEDFVDMVRSPQFGYGKNANPCIDCRIHRLKKAAQIVEEEGAVCLATGEVAGQRPMSQKIYTLMRIEKHAGLKGKLLRPLSAKLLPPTEAETAGIINREKLLDISGRSRAVQLAYSKQHGLKHGSPGGGCLLTNVETAARFNDLAAHNPQFTLEEFKLLAYGRHFRRPSGYRVLVARDGDENDSIERICRLAELPGVSAPWFDVSERDVPISPVSTQGSSKRMPRIHLFYLRDTTGPIAVGLGEPDESDLQFSAAAAVRFSRLRGEARAAVAVSGEGGIARIIETAPATEEELDKYRICSAKTKDS